MNARRIIAAIGAIAIASLVVASKSSSDVAETPAQPADPTSVYDPVSAGESLPEGYRTLLGRDQIEPVYAPVFTEASQVDWPADSLVVGVAGSEAAKAYPVTHLNQHEMVIDVLEGTPILVSW